MVMVGWVLAEENEDVSETSLRGMLPVDSSEVLVDESIEILDVACVYVPDALAEDTFLLSEKDVDHNAV